MIVTIDGPAGAGKSTAARGLARRLGIGYLDTGAMYRAYTLRVLERGLPLDDEVALAASIDEATLEMTSAGEVRLDGVEVSAAIRGPRVTRAIRHLAGNAAVRAKLVAQQQRIGRTWGDLVCDGRDTGTVVFPDADVKFYLDASIAERARRRHRESLTTHPTGDETPNLLEEHEREIAARDQSDRERAVGPLCRAADAIFIECSTLTPAAVLDKLEALTRARLAPPQLNSGARIATT